ncbi:hypothetical protein QOZ88_05975 [Blastococcus sp. BMG 814]|uniref:Major tail protein n=1 Tax=Blastococcus carthaginiensis TaxID=3050034 RepID=A0ABT9I9D4_9ACTN|nr:hypothetical protein [Blastococcus carthaginiensis]MDP5182178.1 hypothetical protein [Blastococcus carthaginiensis]
MAGDVSNAALWGDADVYIGTESAANPLDENTAFGVGWSLCGLLDGDAGITESRSEDSADFYAWGGILVRSSRSKFKLQRKFVCLESNAVTLGLVYPGSTGGVIKVPTRKRFKIAFETREGTEVRRVISALYAEVAAVADITESETALKKYEITVTIFPNAAKELFIVQPADPVAA